MNVKLLLLSLLVVSLAACASKTTRYHWGHYEGIIYNIYEKPGSIDTQTQIIKLSEDIQQAESKGKKVPPGVYAHLGMAYASQGDAASAKAALLEEKALFPASATFIDGILSRAFNQNKKDTAQ